MKRVICEFCLDGYYDEQVVDCDVCESPICEGCVAEHYESEHAEEIMSSDDGPNVFQMTKQKVAKMRGLEEGEEPEDDSYGDSYDDEDEWEYLDGTEQEI